MTHWRDNSNPGGDCSPNVFGGRQVYLERRAWRTVAAPRGCRRTASASSTVIAPKRSRSGRSLEPSMADPPPLVFIESRAAFPQKGEGASVLLPGFRTAPSHSRGRRPSSRFPHGAAESRVASDKVRVGGTASGVSATPTAERPYHDRNDEGALHQPEVRHRGSQRSTV